VEKFWDAQNSYVRLAARGLLPGAIAETTISVWLREFWWFCDSGKFRFLLLAELEIGLLHSLVKRRSL